MRGLNPNFNPTKFERYRSPWQSLAAGTSYSFTHNLSGKPDEIELWAVCITASFGLTVGEEMLMKGHNYTDNTASGHWGYQILLPDDSTIDLDVASNGFLVCNTGVSNNYSTLNFSNFLFQVRAKKWTQGDIPDITRVGLVPLEKKVVANGDADLILNLQQYFNEYEDFRVEWKNLQCATDGSALIARFSDDGGATYESASGDYYKSYDGQVGTAASFGQSATDTNFGFLQATGTASSDERQTGFIDIFDADEPSKNTRCLGRIHGVNSTGTLYNYAVDCTFRPASVCTHLQFLASAGNLAEGTFILYGKRKVT